MEKRQAEKMVLCYADCDYMGNCDFGYSKNFNLRYGGINYMASHVILYGLAMAVIFALTLCRLRLYVLQTQVAAVIIESLKNNINCC